jgi:signal peptidase I
MNDSSGHNPIVDNVKGGMRKPKIRSGMSEFIKTVVYALLIAAVIRSFLFEPFSIPSGSMLPTLLVGDYLFVAKYAYGYSRFSFPFGFPPFSGRIMLRKPVLGDVVVFRLPSDNRTDYIKRVIGLPGDRIQIEHGILNINGKPVERRANGMFSAADSQGFGRKYKQYMEKLPNGREHRILETSDDEPQDNTGVYTVPAGHIFVLGDNRDSSRDSRFIDDVGFVPMENLIGRAEVIFFSIDETAFAESRWGDVIRLSRIFNQIS